MPHRQMFKFTDQLLRSAGRTSKKYNRPARWSILSQFLEINVSIFLCHNINLLFSSSSSSNSNELAGGL